GLMALFHNQRAASPIHLNTGLMTEAHSHLKIAPMTLTEITRGAIRTTMIRVTTFLISAQMKSNVGLMALSHSHIAASPTAVKAPLNQSRAAPAPDLVASNAPTIPSQAGLIADFHNHSTASPTQRTPSRMPSNAGLRPRSQIHMAAFLMACHTVSTTLRKPSKFL